MLQLFFRLFLCSPSAGSKIKDFDGGTPAEAFKNPLLLFESDYGTLIYISLMYIYGWKSRPYSSG
jgi:hypothetical protein